MDTTREKNTPPSSLISLFRYSTRTEKFFDVVGITAAMISGAALPLMTLFCGNLSQGFVSFGATSRNAQAGDQNAIRDLPKAKTRFLHDTATNARYLSYLGVIVCLCTYIFMHIWIYTGEANAKRIREQYLGAVLRKNIAFFDTISPGEVTTRIQYDTHFVQQAISEKMPFRFAYISAFLVGFVLAFVRSPKLALALTPMLPCIFFIGKLMRTFVAKFHGQSSKHVANGGAFAEEVISTIRTVQAFGIQHTLAHIYDGHVFRARVADVRAALYNAIGLGSLFFVVYTSYTFAFYIGSRLIIQGHVDVGTVINVGLSVLIGSLSLAMLAPEMQNLVQGQTAAGKLFATIDHVPDIDSADPGGLKPDITVGDITFEHVNFRYPSRPDVEILRDCCITFPAGKTSAIVGASGAGKSTVVALVERFYDPVSGSVKFDGRDIKELNIKWLRSQIGFVMQEPTLFSTTIKENVAHGLVNSKWENASPEEKFNLIRNACVKANADDFINKLPQGYDTLVGDRGIMLSVGQKQRVAIARAIVSDPRILLLDEATSALDTQSEDVVQEALDKAAAGRTTITIAHRLSTVKEADRIFVLGDGKVLEHGTHAELLERNDAYAQLVHGQSLRGEYDYRSSTAVNSSLSYEGQELKKGTEDVLVKQPCNAVVAAQDIVKSRERAYSLFHLLKRIARLNSASGAKWSYMFGWFFSAVVGLVHPAFTIVWANALIGLSTVDAHQRRHYVDRNALWFFVIAIVAGIAMAVQMYLLTKSSANLTFKLRSLSFKAVLSHDIKFFDKGENNTGSLVSNLASNPIKVSRSTGTHFGNIIRSVSMLLVGIVIGFVFSWKIALVGLACVPALGLAGFAHLWLVVKNDKRNEISHRRAAHLACEAAGSIRTVAALTREEDCCRFYSQSLEDPLKNARRVALRSGVIYGLSQGMTFWVISLVFWYGARQVAALEYTPSEFFVAFMGVTFGALQFGKVLAAIPDISKGHIAACDIFTLLDSQPEIDANSTEGKDPNQRKGRILLKDVHFRYPNRTEIAVLRGLSMKVKPRSYVAVTGASGAGKSTIIHLIERFYDPCTGHIYFDRQPIRELNLQEYRHQLALVTQEPVLYAGTIRFNILLGSIKPESEVTQEEIELACRQANILEFIQALPNGFETEVGGKGSQLSVGQKQRIAIARALIRNPKVLLLDEATSALDSHNAEKVVQEALDNAAAGRTTIVIAHRLSTIQDARCIFFIKDGRFSEAGTHDELLARRGDYYQYCQLQTLHSV